MQGWPPWVSASVQFDPSEHVGLKYRGEMFGECALTQTGRHYHSSVVAAFEHITTFTLLTIHTRIKYTHTILDYSHDQDKGGVQQAIVTN